MIFTTSSSRFRPALASYRHFLIAALCVCAPLAVGCGSDGARNFGGDGSGGGTAATGGATGVGGVVGSSGGVTGGGGSATGGRGGTGGLAATGGRGTGGGIVSLSGGASGTGGNTGTGGISGSGSGGATAVCDGYAAEYQAEMPNAKACLLATSVPQCQSPMPAGLGCASQCTTYVQSPGHLNEILVKWNNNGCPSLYRNCPAILCQTSQPGICALVTGSSGPQCQNTPPVATQ